MICSKNINSKKALSSHSEISNENTDLKRQIINLRATIEQLATENKKLLEENDQLITENLGYNDQLEIIDEAIEKMSLARKKLTETNYLISEQFFYWQE